jgi:hypothetical protein
MNINDYQLRIVGSASLGQELEPDKRIKIMTELEVNEVTKRDNKDGSYDLIYKASICSHIDVQQGEKVWRGKDTKSMSKRLRGAIFHLQDEMEEMDKEPEEFYQMVMGQLIGNLQTIYQMIKKV